MKQQNLKWKKDNHKAFRSIHKEIKDELKTLREDNEFVSASFKKYAKENNIRIVYGTPANPTAQGMAERFVGLTKRVSRFGIIFNN